VKEQFAKKLPGKLVPHSNTVRRLIEKFRETGLVLDSERNVRPSKLNDKKLMDISGSMLWSPSKSLRKLAQEKYIGLATVHKVVREKLNFFPYKVRVVQELKTADYRKRIRYSEWFKNFIQTITVDILDVIIFTDEDWFHLLHYVSTQNARLWSSESPYALHDQKL
jgi:hypothetical protein